MAKGVKKSPFRTRNAALQPIPITPPSPSDKEASAINALVVAGGITLPGPPRITNPLQQPGQLVPRAHRLNGGSSVKPNTSTS
jgi:hypothetical protein